MASLEDPVADDGSSGASGARRIVRPLIPFGSPFHVDGGNDGGGGGREDGIIENGGRRIIRALPASGPSFRTEAGGGDSNGNGGVVAAGVDYSGRLVVRALPKSGPSFRGEAEVSGGLGFTVGGSSPVLPAGTTVASDQLLSMYSSVPSAEGLSPDGRSRRDGALASSPAQRLAALASGRSLVPLDSRPRSGAAAGASSGRSLPHVAAADSVFGGGRTFTDVATGRLAFGSTLAASVARKRDAAAVDADAAAFAAGRAGALAFSRSASLTRRASSRRALPGLDAAAVPAAGGGGAASSSSRRLVVGVDRKSTRLYSSQP